MDRSVRVLVIDDELGIREGCRRALGSFGFQVDAVEDGPSGLAKLRGGTYQVILVDAVLPGLSGLEVIQQALRIDPNVICILITGYPTVELATQAIREGARDLVTKPFTPQQLVHVIHREWEREEHRQAMEQARALEEQARRQERAQAERVAQETERGLLILQLVHTLRGSVGVLQSSIQLLKRGYVAPEEQESFLASLERRATDLLATLDDLLLLAYLKQGVGLAKSEVVSVAEILREAMAPLREQAERQRLVARLETRGDPRVMANRDHVRALWTHLLANAIRYTPEGGEVSVCLRAEPEAGVLVGEVRDTGIGIAPADLMRVFEEFYRADAAKEMQESGTGLGLPIVRQIVEMYKGSIEVESEVGRGSLFRFALPLALSSE